MRRATRLRTLESKRRPFQPLSEGTSPLPADSRLSGVLRLAPGIQPDIRQVILRRLAHLWGGNERRKSDHPLQRAIVEDSGSRQRPTSSSAGFLSTRANDKENVLFLPPDGYLRDLDPRSLVSLVSHPYTVSDGGHDPFFSTLLFRSASRACPPRLGTGNFSPYFGARK